MEPSSPASLAGLRPYTDYVIGSDQLLQEVRNPRPSPPPAAGWGVEIAVLAMGLPVPVWGAGFRCCVFVTV